MSGPARALRSGRQRSKGQAFAELALSMGLLLLVLGGVIEFGNATVETFNISDAARAAARFASRNDRAWSAVDPAAVSTIPWVAHLLAPEVGNKWPNFVDTLTSQPANPPVLSATQSSGIAITYICSAGCPATSATGDVCGYYLPDTEGTYTPGFQIDRTWQSKDSTNNTQSSCVTSGNLVKVGITYLLPPLTRLLTGIAPAGFTLSYATTMPIQ